MDWNGMDRNGLERTVRDGIGKALFKASTWNGKGGDGKRQERTGWNWIGVLSGVHKGVDRTGMEGRG